MVTTMQEWSKRGMKPRVVMLPTFDGVGPNAKKADPVQLGTEEYTGEQGTLDAYFRTIKQAGVTDEEMGTWMLYPGPNRPDSGITADQFRTNATGAAQRPKTHFTSAKVGVVLDGTYHSGNSDLL